MDEAGGSTVTSVERAADVLLLFARAGSRTLGITEIADELAMSKAVHRVLASLRSCGLIELDEATRRYLLGPAVMTLGLRYLAWLDVRQLAFLAFLGEEQAAAYLRQDLAALTEKTITDARRLSRELRRIAERGWAESSGERQPGAASVAPRCSIIRASRSPCSALHVLGHLHSAGPQGRVVPALFDRPRRHPGPADRRRS